MSLSHHIIKLYRYYVTFALSKGLTEVFPQTGKQFTVDKVSKGADLLESQRKDNKVKLVMKHSRAELARVRQITKNKDYHTAIITRYNIKITERDLYSLSEREWLTDNVIFFYLLLLKEYVKTVEDVHVFNTFFIPTATKRTNKRKHNKKSKRSSSRKSLPFNYNNVKRWANKFNLLNKTLVFFPISTLDGTHWVLIVVIYFSGTHNIYYYDSLLGLGDPFKRVIQSYYAHEYEHRRGIKVSNIPGSIVGNEVRVHPDITDRPKQTTNTDCGAFICSYAYCLIHGISIHTFKQKHMKFFRRHMTLSI